VAEGSRPRRPRCSHISLNVATAVICIGMLDGMARLLKTLLPRGPGSRSVAPALSRRKGALRDPAWRWRAPVASRRCTWAITSK